ncbi:MAG: hypothetical protein M2R45_01867 [Verrucomicrobia subdivision 3 bacterium]|nr:hypothetical protein [Limisphaerales bacterium]MCS1415667.1 hypothetical protein [Limisphaerales bacterium]
MFTKLGAGFWSHGKLEASFKVLMERLAGKDGWLVTGGQFLDFLTERPHVGLTISCSSPGSFTGERIGGSTYFLAGTRRQRFLFTFYYFDRGLSSGCCTCGF